MNNLRSTISCLLVLSLSLLPLLTGCHRHSTSPVLLDAENLMEHNPDSALRLLDSLPATQLRGDHDKALYHLLLTQGQLKTGHPLTADSMLKASIASFEEAGDTMRLIKACLYEAMLLKVKGQREEATLNAIKSSDLAHMKDSFIWIARAEEQLADLNYLSLNYPEALAHNGKAIQAYKKAGYDKNVNYSSCDRAFMLFMMSRRREALVLLDSIRDAVRHSEYADAINAYISPGLLELYVRSDMFNKASGLLNEMQDAGQTPFTTGFLASKAMILMHRGETQKAEASLDSAARAASDLNDTVYVYMGHRKINEMAGNYSEAKRYTDSLLYLYNKATALALEDAAVRVQRDTYRLEKENEKLLNASLKTQRSVILLTALVVVLIICGVVIVLWTKKKAQREILEERILSLGDDIKAEQDKSSVLTGEVEKLGGDLASMQSRMETLYQHRLDPMRKIWWEIVNAGENDKVRKSILAQVEKDIQTYTSPKSMKQIENDINHYMDGLADIMRQECAFLKEDDFCFLFFILAGFGTKLTCFFCKLKLGSFYSKKSRLLDKISEADIPHRDKILRAFSADITPIPATEGDDFKNT